VKRLSEFEVVTFNLCNVVVDPIDVPSAPPNTLNIDAGVPESEVLPTRTDPPLEANVAPYANVDVPLPCTTTFPVVVAPPLMVSPPA
jgi:hypothetical protein